MTTLQDAADAVDAELMLQAAALALAAQTPPTDAVAAVAGEMQRRWGLRTLPAVDGRAAQWRCRVRLYRGERDAGDAGEPQADTDPDAQANAPGSAVLSGLPAVADELAALAAAYHGSDCSGLERDTLLHRLKALRPTLSRRGGDAVWRVPYAVYEANGGAGHAWLARVDVERVA